MTDVKLPAKKLIEYKNGKGHKKAVERCGILPNGGEK